jgi:ATP-dependent helicase/nuclease subunit A
MARLDFTPEQRAAIGTRGSSVLVSAAAGSGKTRVLTERLMA